MRLTYLFDGSHDENSNSYKIPPSLDIFIENTTQKYDVPKFISIEKLRRIISFNSFGDARDGNFQKRYIFALKSFINHSQENENISQISVEDISLNFASKDI